MSSDELLSSPGAFIDRHGTLHAGQHMAAELARRLCRAQPERIVARGRQELERIRQAIVTGYYESRTHGGETWRVNKERASEWLDRTERIWSVVGSWCGEQAVDAFDDRQALRNEVERLQRILRSTADWLRVNGHLVKAGLLRRELPPNSDEDGE